MTPFVRFEINERRELSLMVFDMCGLLALLKLTEGLITTYLDINFIIRNYLIAAVK
jgi:hypothetical protein